MVRPRAGRAALLRVGDEDWTCVDEVGTGVGYFAWSSKSSRARFNGRGRTGEERGSNAGKRVDVAFGVGVSAFS